MTVSSPPRVAATAVIVVFRTESLDLAWLPEDDSAIVVHNDTTLDVTTLSQSNVTHLYSGGNIGFGAAVNRALTQLDSDRVVLVNPDVTIGQAHWIALTEPGDDDLRTVNLIDRDGVPTAVVSAYPGALAALLNGYRAARLAPRGSRRRQLLARVLGPGQRDSLSLTCSTHRLRERWASGAVLSIPTQDLKLVGGFDDSYFLYVEDLDLCTRLSAVKPDMRVRVVESDPATHTVGGSTRSGDAEVELHRLDSWCTYVARQRGRPWWLVGFLLQLRRKRLRSKTGRRRG